MRYFLFPFLISGIQAVALPACPSHYQDPNIHLSNLVGKVENRETYQAYAEKRGLEENDIYAKFSATGTFRCGGYAGTANVIKRNNLITLSAHQFLQNGTCKRKDVDFKTCTFETIVPKGQKSQSYRIKPESLELGTDCYRGDDSANDWAIVELESPVMGVRPYNFINPNDIGSKSNDYEELIGLKTTLASAKADNFKPNAPSLCDGEVGGVQAQTNSSGIKEFFIAFACSTGRGSSGAGIVLKDSSQIPTLIGLVGGDHGKDGLPFGPDNFNDGPLIAGRFYQALKRK